ncbi:PREDICTED: nudix hydrolase 18, mitochondrial-like [Populus euphratica]|uniref:Nudix hydrolase 18, mitochondrial-like n=1 Tax=Populus euphratica TaxID=75702 RepID=A0AAJ6SYS8_POPEU|nr:PREDICTED: nudix hydrolase 18, mitochondrial-like [Populus euphratica]
MATALVSQENVVASLVSRTGRHLQRYDKGRRQVVGCIPYRYKNGSSSTSEVEDELEVLVISSQKGKGMLFPKGGWELDETIKQAASRETYEEAGVKGNVEHQLGHWTFQSRTHGTDYDGYLFPLHVKEVLDFWPEKNNRQRKWMSVEEARESCQHGWMKEALDVLVDRLAGRQQLGEDEMGSCPLSYQAKSNL